MEYVQFEIPGQSRRFGFVEGNSVYDVTAYRPDLAYLYDAFQAAFLAEHPLPDFVRSLVPSDSTPALSRRELFEAMPGGTTALCPSAARSCRPASRFGHGNGTDAYRQHGVARSDARRPETRWPEPQQAPQTDSARMFDSGSGRRQAPAGLPRDRAGMVLQRGRRDCPRSPRTSRNPAFALDGGEEPEIVGCYIIDPSGQPRRLGFALGNEWSDHATEAISYLHLAPSKLRTCAMGPTLLDDCDFQDISCAATSSGMGGRSTTAAAADRRKMDVPFAAKSRRPSLQICAASPTGGHPSPFLRHQQAQPQNARLAVSSGR